MEIPSGPSSQPLTHTLAGQMLVGYFWFSILVVVGPFFSVQELCTGGDLYARMPYIEHQVAVVMKQVLNAVNYMHERKVMHRDM